MKKIVIVATVVLFVGSVLTSCRSSHGNCAGITTQAEKVKVSNSPRPL